MEVEVKLRLPDSAAHQSLSSVLSPFLRRTHFQHNVFFDGANSELSALRAVLRLRFYGEDPQTAERCVSSLKAKAILVNGVSRVEEDEEDVDPFVGREIWANPNLIGSSDSRVLKRVKEEFGVKDESGYVCLGGFKNVRGVYEWKGLTLEVDETLFDFGTLYEIECESSEPDKAKEIIEELLKDNGIPYSCSKMSKFAIFRSGELPFHGIAPSLHQLVRLLQDAIWVQSSRVEPNVISMYFNRAVSTIGEFKKANAPSDLVSKNGQPVSYKWMPPMTGVYKLNTDAAFFWNDIVGFGGIVRYSVGDALVTMSHCVRGSYEPDIAEALAARHALGITLEVGINIIMEIF